MTKHPTDNLTAKDIPAAVKGAARYRVRMCETGGADVVMTDTDGHDSVVDHRHSEQSSLRAALRLQKRENDAVTKAAKPAKKSRK